MVKDGSFYNENTRSERKKKDTKVQIKTWISVRKKIIAC